jgi:hypothetical protein
VLTGLGKPDPSVLAKSGDGEDKSGRFNSRTKFDSSSRLILRKNDQRTAVPRGQKHYLEVVVCRGGGLALT